MTYGAWPVKKADPLAGPDASCYSVTPGRRLEAAQEVRKNLDSVGPARWILTFLPTSFLGARALRT